MDVQYQAQAGERKPFRRIVLDENADLIYRAMLGSDPCPCGNF